MSHISTWKHKIKDFDVLQKVCQELGYNLTYNKETEVIGDFWNGQKQGGRAMVKLNKWRYPLVIGDDGEIFYDNFGAESNSMDEFGIFLQKYNETAIMETVDFTEFDSIETFTNENGEKEIIMTIY